MPKFRETYEPVEKEHQIPSPPFLKWDWAAPHAKAPREFLPGDYWCPERWCSMMREKGADKMAAEIETKETCRRCGSDVVIGRCQDQTCPYSDRPQTDPEGMAGHPESDEKKAKDISFLDWNWRAEHTPRKFFAGDYQSIEKDLVELINKQSRENRSNTPDFILAQFMARCLKAAEDAVNARDSFYGIRPEPGGVPANTVERQSNDPDLARVAGPAPCVECGKPTVLGKCSACVKKQVFGTSPIEGALKDALHFENVRKTVRKESISRLGSDKTDSIEALAEPITTTISNCARCGGTHERLKFTKMSGEPIGDQYTHWATCPKTGEPIVLLITMQNGEKGYAPS